MKNVEGNKFFENARKKAGKLLTNNERMKQLFNVSKEKLSEIDVSAVTTSKLANRLRTLIRMVKAYRKGEYRDIQVQNIILIVAAIVYFVTPLDLVPDFIPITGLIDDFTVVLWVYNKLQEEIDRFLEWENSLQEG
ncbi:MAG: YkvA family protein [Fulvivirga sp.]|uniref:YkvA family protein n=1 Tax=Fulvivirga sp. TaxID=1931237 RepID=UPI0032ED8A1D